MGFRFQKRIKLLPGVSVNLSKSGISTSFGVKGARVTKGHGKTRTTVGLPGTGISHTSVTSNKPKPTKPPEDDGIGIKNILIGIAFIAVLFAIAKLFS